MPDPGRMRPPQGGAVVRMYCTGLGDCFLLGFPDAAGETAYVLIDFGVWKGTPGAAVWMRTIFGHIREEVGERGLDLLVATHAHWDHLSGFSQAREIFTDPGFRVKKIWMPWTEDPGDATAVGLVAERRTALRTAVAAVTALRGQQEQTAAAGDPQGAAEIASTVASLETLLKFSGYTPPGDLNAREEDRELAELGMRADPDLLGAGPSTDDLLEIVRAKRGPEYPRPSLDRRALDGVPKVSVVVLGPPTDPKLLGKDDPSKAPGKSEVYLSEDAALYAAASAQVKGEASLDDELRRELAQPFDRWQRFSLESAEDHSEFGDFIRCRYPRRRSPALDWRRIDTDWLEAATQLALNLDAHVNNTSLALAFELGPGGPVLLFPGDAQVGNWLSWHKLPPAEGVTATELLARTVLYKVGHHGSHNATLKALGLEKMTDPRLVAMIPVDEAEARKPKGKNKDGWAMPYDKLLADLETRTAGRVLRADAKDVPAAAFPASDPPRVGRVTVDFGAGPVERVLFIEHTVPGPS